MFQAEPRSCIEARKRDATRVLQYAPDRGNSQSVYKYSIHDPRQQPCILVKPKWAWGVTTPDELIAAEDRAYREWVKQLDSLSHDQIDNAPDGTISNVYNLYERNIEVWRQLWRTIERSDVIVHLADARCPVLHISDQLVCHVHNTYPHKRVVLVLTKADLVSSERVSQWEVFLKARYGASLPLLSYNQGDKESENTKLLHMIGKVASTINKSEREVFRHADEDTLTIGFVGEPNVGKSSLLNCLFDRKLVSVSSTPGHTKHLQTHYFESIERLELSVNHFNKVLVCDCPGVVFPRLNVPLSLQILFGSFPIAQTREPFSAIRFIAENCDPPIHEIYKLKPVEETDEGTLHKVNNAANSVNP